MRLLIAPMLLAMPLLAACHAKPDRETTVEKTVTITTDGDKSIVAAGGDHGFGIDTGKFKMALDIPGMTMSGGNLDINGMKLFPGSEVRGMKVTAHEKDDTKDSKVVFTFTSPAAPAAVLDHAVKQAESTGWTVARSGNTLSGSKDEQNFALALTANGARTDGTMTISGED